MIKLKIQERRSVLKGLKSPKKLKVVYIVTKNGILTRPALVFGKNIVIIMTR